MMSSPGFWKSTGTSRGPTLDFGSLMCADVGQIVLRHLASTQDRVRVCRSVSQECRQLVDSQVHSLRANLKSLSTHDDSLALPLRFPRLESLSFDRAAASESSRLLHKLATHQPQLLATLRELDLSTCQGLEADALAALLQAASGLNSLRLPSLAPGVTSSQQDFMRAISTYGTHLRHLQGVGDYITPDTIHHLSHLTLLQSLDLSTERHALNLPPRSLRAIAACRHLTSLSLGNHLACWDMFELAAELPALQQLEFSYTREVDVSVQEFAPLKHSRTIQRLAISGVPCSDQLLEVLAASPVTDLSIHAGAFCASPKGAALMAGRLQKLQLLVNDRDNAAFTAALPVLGSSLSSLSLSLHKASADCRPLLQAVFSLPALQHLSLGSHYNGLTEGELQDLPVLTHCTSLSLSNHFTDATLCAALRSTPHLRQLQLGSSGEVGSLGLGCVLGHCRGLREVRLVLMRGVTAAGVAALASGPCVSRVVLEGCRNVSAEECRELMRLLNRPDLHIIKLR